MSTDNYVALRELAPSDDVPWCPLKGGPVTPGERYQLTYHARGNGNFDIWDATNKAWVTNTVRNSIEELNGYSQAFLTFTAPKGCMEVWFVYRFTGDNTSYIDGVSMVCRRGEGMIDPRNPAFLINDKRAWKMSRSRWFHWRWWAWVFWRNREVRRHHAALRGEEER